MPRYFLRLLLLGLLLSLFVAGTTAQDLTTTRTESGYLVDHPEEWNIEFPEDYDSVIYFDDGAMFGLMSIVEQDIVGADPSEVLEDLIDDLDNEDANNGDFVEPYLEYRLDEQWDLVRTTRVRSNDRRLEYFFMATVRELSVFVRVNFRRGGEDEYLPQMEAMIASARHEVDEQAPIPEISSNTSSFNIEFIGAEDNLLQIGALTASYSFEDASYQFNYPDTWEISTNADGSLRFINRAGSTVFGTLRVQAKGTDTAESALSNFLADETGYTTIESFSLNGLTAARAYRDNSRGGTKELVMSALRGDFIGLMTVTSNAADFAGLEAIFRAVLYSLRPNGTALELSLVGTAARRGLSSAYIYGASSPNPSTVISPQTAIPLEQVYETSNGRYTFNYPEDWYDDLDQGSIILSNNRRYELFSPNEGEIQIAIFFVDRIRNLDIDEFSPEALLEYVIDNDENSETWGEIRPFSNLGRRGAYVDYEPRGNWNMRTYFVELDAVDLVYVRMDMVTRDDEIEDFEPYALAILETVDFAE